MSVPEYQAAQLFLTSADLASWRVVKEHGEFRLVGRCFHCHDSCMTEIRTRVLLGGSPAGLEQDDDFIEGIPREVLCNCENGHPGRPDNVLAGCGRFWRVLVQKRTDQTWAIEPFTDPTLFSALHRLSVDERTEGDRLRAAAEKWIGAVTALCGLFSVAGLVAVKDALAGVGMPGRIMVALFYLGALGAAGAALINGYTAAYGWPTEVETTTVSKVRAYDRARREQAADCARRLRQAVILSCTTLGLLSVMVLILWLLPRADATATPSPAPSSTNAPTITSTP